MTTVRQVLAVAPGPDPEPSDGKEAARVEQAVAWMFGLAASPVLADPVVPEAELDPEPAPGRVPAEDDTRTSEA